MGTLLLLSLLSLSPSTLPDREVRAQAPDVEPAAPGETARPPAAAPAPAPGAPAPQPGEKPFDVKQLPWKLISKVSASTLYGAWVALWTVGLLPAAVGGLLISLGGSGEESNLPLMAGGGVLVAVAAAAWTVGLACAASGTALGVVALVLAQLQPSDASAETQNLLFVIPRQLFL